MEGVLPEVRARGDQAGRAQHDREESVPYEVMKEAYEWKLAGLEWIQALQTDTEGLKGVIYAEELHWGCAGIALAISASTLCARPASHRPARPSRSAAGSPR